MCLQLAGEGKEFFLFALFSFPSCVLCIGVSQTLFLSFGIQNLRIFTFAMPLNGLLCDGIGDSALRKKSYDFLIFRFRNVARARPTTLPQLFFYFNRHGGSSHL